MRLRWFCIIDVFCQNITHPNPNPKSTLITKSFKNNLAFFQYKLKCCQLTRITFDNLLLAWRVPVKGTKKEVRVLKEGAKKNDTVINDEDMCVVVKIQHKHMQIRIYIYIYINIFIHIHSHTLMYIHTHTYKYTKHMQSK